jgi:germination protein M
MRKLAALVSITVYIFMLSACAGNGGKQMEYSDNAIKISGNGTMGNFVGETKQKDTTKLSDTANTSKEKISAVLYYQDKEGFLVPITLKFSKTTAIARTVIGKLTDSDITRAELSDVALLPVLPKGTTVRGINIKDNVASIDFSSNLLKLENSKAERNAVSSLVYTLTELKTIKEVKITIEGKTYGKLKNGTDISGFLSRKNVLVNSGSVNLEKGISKFDAYIFRMESDKLYYLVPVSKEIKKGDIKSRLSGAVDFMSRKFDEK